MRQFFAHNETEVRHAFLRDHQMLPQRAAPEGPEPERSTKFPGKLKDKKIAPFSNRGVGVANFVRFSNQFVAHSRQDRAPLPRCSLTFGGQR
jgi:hypothetical protein